MKKVAIKKATEIFKFCNEDFDKSMELIEDIIIPTADGPDITFWTFVKIELNKLK